MEELFPFAFDLPHNDNYTILCSSKEKSPLLDE